MNRLLALAVALVFATLGRGAPTDRPPGGRIRVDGAVMEKRLIRKVAPVVASRGMQARIRGTVRFNAVVGKDGRVVSLRLASGHPLLVPAARKAACQWEYQPVPQNGRPVEVLTQIDVRFTFTPG